MWTTPISPFLHRGAAAFGFVAGLGLLAACNTAGDVQNPFTGVTSAFNAPDSQRGAVELAVKSEFPAILSQIDAGGGPALTAAFDAAGVPPQDRPARIIQLQRDAGIYASNPGALSSALLVWGG
ncbi:hypothetical protein [Loktanella salsilacus]|uniref:hypothetical protein n=1 Tax=Loktanella salsilacus TaxID=195913 RepID=UPI00373614F5